MLCIKLVKYRDKYTEMHGQQNVKKSVNVLFTNISRARTSFVEIGPLTFTVYLVDMTSYRYFPYFRKRKEVS